jgi:hypothetical protein
MTRRIHDYPDDPEAWPDLEEELIPDPAELPTSGPYGPAFTYLHAARVTLDAGLTRPTLLLTRTGARLILKTAGEHGHEVTDQEAEDLEQIARGELEALVFTKSAELYPLRENTTRLFEDPMATERAYHEETGLYPVMHNVVIQNDLLDDHPWVATELLKAFRRSVDVFQERARYEAKYPLVWWQQYRQEERDVFGDIWRRSFELEPNRDEVTALVRYAFEQGLLEDLPDPEELFFSVE